MEREHEATDRVDPSSAGDGSVALSAAAIAARVREGSLDAVELVRTHLRRIAERDRQLHAFEQVREEEALLSEAKALRDRSDLQSLSLAGVAVAIKDNVAVAGQPTRQGSLATPAEPEASDDELVARLRRAGAIVIGKTTMPELAIWPFTERAGREPTRNPQAPDLTAGGSSGGSAVAVASEMAALALGSDGGGSIRIPAACCGIVGFKPAPGLVPLAGGAAAHWYGLTAFGPLARSVSDAALMLAVLANDDRYRDPEPPGQGLTVAVSARHPVVGAPVAAPVRSALDDAAATLESLGHEVKRASPPYPPSPQAFMRCWLGGIAEDAADLEPSTLEPRTQAMVRQGQRLRRRGWVHAATDHRAARKLRAWFDDGCDVLMTPVLAQDPPAVGKWAGAGWLATTLGVARWMGYTTAWNLAGFATLTLPVGRSPAGMPIAVQLVGPPGSEQRLLSLGVQLEARRLVPQ